MHIFSYTCCDYCTPSKLHCLEHNLWNKQESKTQSQYSDLAWKRKKKVEISINKVQDVFQLKMFKWIAKLPFEIQGARHASQAYYSDVYNYKPVILSPLQRHGLFCPVSEKSKVWVSALQLSLQYRAKSQCLSSDKSPNSHSGFACTRIEGFG